VGRAHLTTEGSKAPAVFCFFWSAMEPEIGVSVFLSVSVAKDGAKVAAMISSPLVRLK